MKRKNGFTLVESIIVVVIVALLLLILISSVITANRTPKGEKIPVPEPGIEYEVRGIEIGGMTVIAIPHDAYYPKDGTTLHRVILKVNNSEIIQSGIGTRFMRDSQFKRDQILRSPTAVTNWVDYGTDVAPTVIRH